MFKEKKLCYSVNEAHRMLDGHMTRSTSAWSNRRYKPSNKSFDIRWRYISEEELSANMYCDRKVYLIGILGVGFRNDYGRGNQFSKVVHDEAREDFLVNVLHFFCVKMKQPNSVF